MILLKEDSEEWYWSIPGFRDHRVNKLGHIQRWNGRQWRNCQILREKTTKLHSVTLRRPDGLRRQVLVADVVQATFVDQSFLLSRFGGN